jgi:NADPH2:quinone reductase
MMMHGSHAELAGVAAHKTWPIPETVSFAEAATVPVEFGTASDCLFEFGHLEVSETVLVRGATGGVGVAAVQLARAAGATVLATTRGDDRLGRLAELGADHAIDDRGDVAAEVQRLTDGHGADLVVDPVGGRVLETSIRCLAYRGRISWVGNAAAHSAPPDLWPLMEKNGQINALFFAMEQSRQRQRTYHLVADLLERIGTGELTAVIDRTFPLSEAAAAHRYAEDEPTFGRVVLVP